jgi:exosome complex component CSL4
MTSSSNIPLPQIALPGQPLGLLSSYIPGPGTHLPPSIIPNPSPSSLIRASILGPTITTPPPKKGLPILSISRQEAENQQTQTILLPKEGSVVLGRVTRINIREARVQILVINDVPTMEEFTGVIRYIFTRGIKVMN